MSGCFSRQCLRDQPVRYVLCQTTASRFGESLTINHQVTLAITMSLRQVCEPSSRPRLNEYSSTGAVVESENQQGHEYIYVVIPEGRDDKAAKGCQRASSRRVRQLNGMICAINKNGDIRYQWGMWSSAFHHSPQAPFNFIALEVRKIQATGSLSQRAVLQLPKTHPCCYPVDH